MCAYFVRICIYMVLLTVSLLLASPDKGTECERGKLASDIGIGIHGGQGSEWITPVCAVNKNKSN